MASANKPTVFGREPVAIGAAVEALLMLAIGFGAPITGEQVALINVALLAVLALVARQAVTANANVVERLDRSTAQPSVGKTGDVVAGPANEMAERAGQIIRQGRGGYLEGQGGKIDPNLRA